MMDRAVLYARVSRDDSRQDGRNLDGQIQLGEAYAAKHNYTIVARLAEDDKGASGADINLPQLTTLRTLASDKAFDVLVVREIDRLSRSLAKQLILEQELKRHGVRIEYILGEYPDTPEGTLMRHIRATVAEYEREKINERVVRGRYSKVKAGSVLVAGLAPFGYHLVHKDNMYSLEVHESEAEVVRMIFGWYVNGIATRKIASKLSSLGIPSYSDNRPVNQGRLIAKRLAVGTWGRGSVRHILMNETYVGTWHYGKSEGRGGKKKRAKKDQVSVNVPAIIDRHTWEAAQTMRATNRSVRRHSSGYDYLLKGQIFCEHCGHRMGSRTSHVGGKVYAYYRCNAYRRELAEECKFSNVHYPAKDIDATVWNWLATQLTNPEQLRNGLQAYQADKEQHVAPLRERLHLIEEMLSTDRDKLERLLDLYLTGEFSRDLLVERKTRLEAQIRALENEELSLRGVIDADTISMEQIDVVRQFGEEIADKLEEVGNDIDLMRQVIRVVNLQVRLSSYKGEKAVSVQCGIGTGNLSLKNITTCDSYPCNNRLPWS